MAVVIDRPRFGALLDCGEWRLPRRELHALVMHHVQRVGPAQFELRWQTYIKHHDLASQRDADNSAVQDFGIGHPVVI